MNAHPRVNVLLSTYNGERFIVELLDSLLKQSYSNIALHIRDDGSTDNTVALIKSSLIHNESVTLTVGNNIGVTASFLKLLADSGEPGDLYAFCDQDDIWKPEKITRAVEQIMNRPEPGRVLYCSRLEYVDEQLKHLGFSLVPRLVGFNNAIVENIATGCTIVFGETIRQLILKGMPDDMLIHDWWAYLVASVFGDIIYDEISSIQYRQHGDTFTAWEPGHSKLLARVRDFVIRLRMHEHEGLDSLNQAVRFLGTYPDMSSDAKKTVVTLLALRKKGTFWRRLVYITHPKVLRTEPLENMALKAMILFAMH